MTSGSESLLPAQSVTGLNGPIDKALWLLGEGRLRGWDRRKIDEVVANAAAERVALREAVTALERIKRTAGAKISVNAPGINSYRDIWRAAREAILLTTLTTVELDGEGE